MGGFVDAERHEDVDVVIFDSLYIYYATFI